MFRDDRQKHATIRTLLSLGRLERLWTATGPKNESFRFADMNEAERNLVSIAWSIHEGKLEEITVVSIDASGVAKQIFELLAAMKESPDAVDRWSLKHEPHERGAELKALKGARPYEWAKIVAKALDQAGSALQAAKALDVSPRTMRRWLHHPALKEAAPKWIPKES